jgi:hypothetical protein
MFDRFLNGTENETILLSDERVIKSLSGVIAELKSFRYVQKVIEHRLHSDMVAANSVIDVGLLIRVWGDAAGVNGLYKKTADAVFTKVSYQDLVDLIG